MVICGEIGMLLNLRLDQQSDHPIYRQLYEQIKSAIQTGLLDQGEKLPATRELAGQLGLNRTTVSAAYELLESEGLIRGHVGRGSFVNGPSSLPETRVNWSERMGGASVIPPPPFTEGGISFAASRPAEALFPIEEFRATCREVIASAEAASILQLGSSSGYAPLRRYLLIQAREDGTARPDDDILITSGCQQALDLIPRVLLSSGETVVLEDPVYPGLKSVFDRVGVRVIGVPVGAQGMDIEQLGRVLAKEKPQLLVVTSSFQNPTGTTLPLSSRQTLIEMARTAGAIVIENDLYGDLRYEGAPIPMLKELDESGGTILLRSFSKIAFPGLRVGWVTGPRHFIARLAEAKQFADLHTDQLSQAVLLRFAESGRLEAHRRRMLTAGAERLAAVLEACTRELPAGARFTRPQGGMNLWVRLPEPLDTGELLPRAQHEHVSYVPGKYFAVSHNHASSLRLSFAGLEPDQIRAGVKILGEIFKKELERATAAWRDEPAPAMV